MTWTTWWVNPRHLVSIANISSRLASNHKLVVILSSVIPKSHFIWYFSSFSRAWWAPLVYVSSIRVWATRLPSILVTKVWCFSSDRSCLIFSSCFAWPKQNLRHVSSVLFDFRHRVPKPLIKYWKNRVRANFAPSCLLDHLILITFGLW